MIVTGCILIILAQAFIWPGAWLLRDGMKRWSAVDVSTGVVALVIGLSMVGFGLSVFQGLS